MERTTSYPITMPNECRYCLEGGGLLISPCACSGTNQYVHRECLDRWRSTNPDYDRICRECNTPYTFVRDVFPENQIIFPEAPLYAHYVLGIVSIMATTVVTTTCDRDASSSLPISHYWDSNFTEVVKNDEELLVLYSASFGSACFYSAFVIATAVYLSCTLNRPIYYLSRIPVLKSYSVAIILSQLPNITYYIIGHFPYFSTTISYTITCFLPLWTYWFIESHNSRSIHSLTAARPGDR